MMIKKFLILLFIVKTSFLECYAQSNAYNHVWSHFGADTPSWFTNGNEANTWGDNSFSGVERGIAFNPVTNHVLVASRHAVDTNSDGSLDIAAPHIYILDSRTGLEPENDIAALSTKGITYHDIQGYGGQYPLNNITITQDHKILGCNLTLSSASNDINGDDSFSINSFRVYLWESEYSEPVKVIDYAEGGHRLGDYISVIGQWDSEAYIYAGTHSNILLRWKVVNGSVETNPEIIVLENVSDYQLFQPAIAPVYTNNDSFYISGKGFLPTLFDTTGNKFSQFSINSSDLPSTLVGGRTILFNDRLYMAMFSGDQSALIVDVTEHGTNVTEEDVIGFTPVFGEKYNNAYGAGSVDLGIMNDSLFVFICAPSNGIACFQVDSFIKSTPMAKDVSINLVLNGNYNFYDLKGDSQGESKQAWYTADTFDGQKTMEAADTNIYYPKISDMNKYIFYGVTPISSEGVKGKEEFDTIRLNEIIYDTIKTEIIDTVIIEVIDTVNYYIYDSISVTDTLIIDVQTGKNSSKVSKVKVYPNPANEKLYIEVQDEAETIKDYTISLFNPLGELEYEFLLDKQLIIISLDKFEKKGLYFIQILNNSNHIIDVRKILLQ